MPAYLQFRQRGWNTMPPPPILRLLILTSDCRIGKVATERRRKSALTTTTHSPGRTGGETSTSATASGAGVMQRSSESACLAGTGPVGCAKEAAWDAASVAEVASSNAASVSMSPSWTLARFLPCVCSKSSACMLSHEGAISVHI